MRTIVMALAAIAILTAPAYSQGRGKGAKHSAAEQRTEQQKKRTAESEQAYKSALDKVPDKTYDPWAHMR